MGRHQAAIDVVMDARRKAVRAITHTLAHDLETSGEPLPVVAIVPEAVDNDDGTTGISNRVLSDPVDDDVVTQFEEADAALQTIGLSANEAYTELVKALRHVIEVG